MVPTRLSTSIFSAKAAILRLQRRVRDAADPIPTHLNRPPQPHPVLAARSITSLFPDATAPEHWYQRGKVENLRVAAARLDGCFIPAHQLFSFWQQVGRPSRRRGFQIGRMLQEGCVIPSIGGGLCQLSNALYQVALASGCEIVERHAHSRVVPGSATSLGRDATVAWNYIDLRFRPPFDIQLGATLTTEHLVVSVTTSNPKLSFLSPSFPGSLAPTLGDEHACGTCTECSCFRHSHTARLQNASHLQQPR